MSLRKSCGSPLISISSCSHLTVWNQFITPADVKPLGGGHPAGALLLSKACVLPLQANIAPQERALHHCNGPYRGGCHHSCCDHDFAHSLPIFQSCKFRTMWSSVLLLSLSPPLSWHFSWSPGILHVTQCFAILLLPVSSTLTQVLWAPGLWTLGLWSSPLPHTTSPDRDSSQEHREVYLKIRTWRSSHGVRGWDYNVELSEL